MTDDGKTLAAKLDELVEEFADLDPRERLEILLDYAEKLPPLPDKYAAQRDAGEHRVHECQTPVFLWVEVHDGQVRLLADSAPEAPTVKGFIGLLVDTFSGASPAEILAVDARLVTRLGLVESLGMVRMRGLHAILARILREVGASTAN